MEEVNKQLEKSIEILKSYKRLFDTEDGETVLNDIMTNSGFLNPIHVVGDPYSSANNEGKRELFLYILQKVTADPSDILNRISRIKEQQKGEFYE